MDLKSKTPNAQYSTTDRNTDLSAVGLSLFLSAPLLELHATHVHDGGSDLIDVVLVLFGEAQDIERFLQYAHIRS